MENKNIDAPQAANEPTAPADETSIHDVTNFQVGSVLMLTILSLALFLNVFGVGLIALSNMQ